MERFVYTEYGTGTERVFSAWTLESARAIVRDLEADRTHSVAAAEIAARSVEPYRA